MSGQLAPSRRVLWIAYVVGAFGLGFASQINFLVPLRARELGATLDVVGVIVAANALAPALFSVPLGTVTDRIGPRRAFIVGTAASAVAALGLVVATSLWALFVLQVVLGSTRALAWVSSHAYITGLGRSIDRVRRTGRFGFFSNVGAMVGPLAAGAVAQAAGIRYAFLFVAGYAAAFALLGCLLQPVAEADGLRRPTTGGAGYRTAWQLLAIPALRVALLLTAVRLWISWTWTSFFPVLLVDAGLLPVVVGSVVAMQGLAATLSAPTTGLWCRFGSPAVVAVCGLAVGVVGLALSPQLVTVPLVYIAPILVGVASGLSLPLLLSIVSEAAPQGQRGVALGLRQSVNHMAAAGAPLTIGPMATAFGGAMAFALSGSIAGTVLIGAFVLHLSTRPRRR